MKYNAYNAGEKVKKAKKVTKETKEMDKSKGIFINPSAILKSVTPLNKVEKNHQTEIFEYIRRRKNGMTYKVGVVFGMIDNGVIKIGWSKCNAKAGDKFDSIDGLAFAKHRAVKPDSVPIPNCIRTQLRQFSSRCVRYFKDAKKLELPA